MKPSSTDTQEVEQHLGEQGAPEGMSSEQAADLAALRAAAAPVAQPGQVVEAEPERPDLGTEIAGAVTMAVALLGPIYPSLREIYTPETTQAAAGAVAAVCNKHGWLQGGMMGEYGEEITCLLIVGPLALATYKGVQADNAARAKTEPAKEGGELLDLSAPAAPAGPAPGEPVGQKTVTFGAPA